MLGEIFLAPSAGFEPALMAPEATALSPELRGRDSEYIAYGTTIHSKLLLAANHKSILLWRVSEVQSRWCCLVLRQSFNCISRE